MPLFILIHYVSISLLKETLSIRHDWPVNPNEGIKYMWLSSATCSWLQCWYYLSSSISKSKGLKLPSVFLADSMTTSAWPLQSHCMHLTLICIFICDLICLLLGLKMHRFKIVCHYHLEVWFGSFVFFYLLFIFVVLSKQSWTKLHPMFLVLTPTELHLLFYHSM